ncbi:CHAP domain-containing protein [Sphingomonas abietis]|uniref:CHAP domain-containing protein n=1 Tax=Sphingomonas abietis TaxID=3012344 RepID=A0ABY7NMN5_9SPHN|nr:CHAP domain-containing protein [Sphingomonas abietis]WBO22778.1 CHAP domain-containing protein [Sphingomonas abietis]
MKGYVLGVIAAVTAVATPAVAQDSYDGRIGAGLECVPYARQMSGIQIYGNAWTWWDQASARYQEGAAPKVGAVLVFRPKGVMKLGHVAVVSKIVSSRILMISHANWSRIGGVRGQIEKDVTLVDVSAGNDWSEVRVWWRDNHGLGTTRYPVYGFIYGRDANSGEQIAHVSKDLASASPDIVGAVIDSLGAAPAS